MARTKRSKQTRITTSSTTRTPAKRDKRPASSEDAAVAAPRKIRRQKEKQDVADVVVDLTPTLNLEATEEKVSDEEVEDLISLFFSVDENPEEQYSYPLLLL